ncbi:hypothetical protein HDU98_004734, partial [Podochytrium sp. JEL0797]
SLKYIRYQYTVRRQKPSRHPLFPVLSSLHSSITSLDIVDFDLILVLVAKIHALTNSVNSRSSRGGGSGFIDTGEVWGVEGIAERIEAGAWEALEGGVEEMIEW